MNVQKLKQDFPIFERKIQGKRLVYLDNAATTQKPWQVCEEMDVYYCHSNANIHRGVHSLAEEATKMYEDVRKKVWKFVDGDDDGAVVFTRNATEGINLVAQSYALPRLKAGDQIVLTEMEHHANLLPWQRVARATGAELVYIPVNDTGELVRNWREYITEKAKIVSVCHVSNLLGTINPIKEICDLARHVGAISVVDAAQSAPHMQLHMSSMKPDFVVFSGHKILGPTGVGVLYGRQDLLEEMEPYMVGGSMIKEVDFETASWSDVPWKFEAGTPNIAGVIGLGRAIEYLDSVDMETIAEHSQQLTSVALEELAKISGLTLYGPAESIKRIGIVAFNVEGIHAHDLASLLDEDGVAIRAGHHCVQPLVRKMGIPATARASFYVYNDESDVAALVKSIKRAKRVFKV